MSSDRHDEFLRPPLWRMRTSPDRRASAAIVTFLLVVVVGVGLMWLAISGLRWLGSSGWVAALPWIAPTVGAVVWAMGTPTPAMLTDDDDDSWIRYSVRLLMVGAEEQRSKPVRVVVASLFGAPVFWAYSVFGLIELTGII